MADLRATCTACGAEQSLGKRLRFERDKRGWSLRELAQRSGVSVRTLRRLEDDNASVSLRMIGAVAYAFGLTVAPNIVEKEPARD